ncbi:hypothetical protein [Streptomyces sp. NPDC002205]|uniref:hypothetical protein n=1 Tax=unclassified Streptomyces TaxID=2593676 RepID=UPI00332FFB6D
MARRCRHTARRNRRPPPPRTRSGANAGTPQGGGADTGGPGTVGRTSDEDVVGETGGNMADTTCREE